MSVKFDSSNLLFRDLRNTTFDNCSFYGTTMTASKIEGATFSKPTGLTIGQIKSTQGWKFAYYPTDIIDSLELPVDHNTRLFKKQLFSYSFSNTYFEEVILDSFDFNNADFQKAEIFGGEFIACNLDSAIFDSANLVGTIFSNCNLRFASMEEADLRNIIFINCDLTGLDFQGAQLYNIDFTNSVLDSIDLRKSTIVTPKGLNENNTKNIIIDATTRVHTNELTNLRSLPDSSIKRIILESLQNP